MKPLSAADRIGAVLLVLLVLLTILVEWGSTAVAPLRMAVAVAVVLILTPRAGFSRKCFAGAALVLTAWCYAVDPNWQDTLARAIGSAAFIGGFFCALASLRNAAAASPAVGAAGAYLASQPPGRRYAALSLGGHLFALLLSYGAISLLGSLAANSVSTEQDPIVRGHRLRRMLLAIQRGFVSTLPWSPLSFSMAITTVLIPGASWEAAVLPGAVSAMILFSTGWVLDTVFKPRLAIRPPRRPVDGSLRSLSPLFVLLAVLTVLTGALHMLSDVRIIGVVVAVVPLLSCLWAVQQYYQNVSELTPYRRMQQFVFADLPSYRSEIVLLMMAGYIGSCGAPLLAPVVTGLGLDFAELPGWTVVVTIIWVIPVLGQLGLHPILAVTLFAPLIPTATELGTSPAAVVTAIVAGWSVSGICSPFTATTVLIGAYGNTSALHVGFRWNGLYVVFAGAALTSWALAFAFLLQ